MNCSEFEIELQETVESRRENLSDAGTQHIVECIDCRRCWVDHRLVEAAINALPRVNAPQRLAESVIAVLLGGQSVNVAPSGPLVAASRPFSVTSPSNREGRWVIVAAAAMCVVLALGLGLTDRDLPLQVAVSSLPGSAVPPGSVEVASSVAAVFDDLRAEYHELAAETKATARDFAAALPPSVPTVWNPGKPVLSGLDQESQPSEGTDRATASRSVSNIGRSVSDQIGQAIDFLWVAAPDSEPRG